MPSFKLWSSLKATIHKRFPRRERISLREMGGSYPYSPILVGNLSDDKSINDIILFMRSFMNDTIRPNNGQDAPPKQTSAFIELVADPRVLFVVQIAIPELWSDEGVALAKQNPWIWAMRCVTRPLGGECTVYDARTQAKRRMVNTAAVVLAVLNVLRDDVELDMLPEIEAVKRVFAMRLAGRMPR